MWFSNSKSCDWTIFFNCHTHKTDKRPSRLHMQTLWPRLSAKEVNEWEWRKFKTQTSLALVLLTSAETNPDVNKQTMSLKSQWNDTACWITGDREWEMERTDWRKRMKDDWVKSWLCFLLCVWPTWNSVFFLLIVFCSMLPWFSHYYLQPVCS